MILSSILPAAGGCTGQRTFLTTCLEHVHQYTAVQSHNRSIACVWIFVWSLS